MNRPEGGWVPVVPLAELEEGRARAFPLDGGEAIVLRRGGAVHAYRNRCPHQGVPLNWLPDQFMDPTGDFLQCGMHGALFEPRTGRCVYGPCRGRFLPVLEATVWEGVVYLRPGAPATPP